MNCPPSLAVDVYGAWYQLNMPPFSIYTEHMPDPYGRPGAKAVPGPSVINSWVSIETYLGASNERPYSLCSLIENYGLLRFTFAQWVLKARLLWNLPLSHDNMKSVAIYTFSDYYNVRSAVCLLILQINIETEKSGLTKYDNSIETNKKYNTIRASEITYFRTM